MYEKNLFFTPFYQVYRERGTKARERGTKARESTRVWDFHSSEFSLHESVSIPYEVSGVGCAGRNFLGDTYPVQRRIEGRLYSLLRGSSQGLCVGTGSRGTVTGVTDSMDGVR